MAKTNTTNGPTVAELKRELAAAQERISGLEAALAEARGSAVDPGACVLRMPVNPRAAVGGPRRRRVEVHMSRRQENKLMVLYDYLRREGARIPNNRVGSQVPTRELLDPPHVLVWLLENVELTGAAGDTPPAGG